MPEGMRFFILEKRQKKKDMALGGAQARSEHRNNHAHHSFQEAHDSPLKEKAQIPPAD
jgi:hypothetical protein